MLETLLSFVFIKYMSLVDELLDFLPGSNYFGNTINDTYVSRFGKLA